MSGFNLPDQATTKNTIKIPPLMNPKKLVVGEEDTFRAGWNLCRDFIIDINSDKEVIIEPF